MRKWNILILIVILLIPLVQAELPFCGNMQKINQECRLVTPSMTCSSNATIINGSGNIKTISLNQLNSFWSRVRSNYYAVDLIERIESRWFIVHHCKIYLTYVCS
jgi:hypothetical protein